MNSKIDTHPPQGGLPSPGNGNGTSHSPAPLPSFWHRGKDTIPAGGVHDLDNVGDEGIIAAEDLLDDAAEAFSDDEYVEGSDADKVESAHSLHTVRLSAPSVDVVHEALKGPEVGFKFEVAGLEKEARRLAQASADRGLPRHDLESDEPIEEEVVLAQRAGEIYAGWIRRVRHKVDTAISTQTQLLNGALENGWQALESYRTAENTIHRLAPREPARAHPVHNDSRTDTSSSDPQSIETPAQVVAAPRVETSKPLNAQPTPDAIQIAGRSFYRGFWPLTLMLVFAEFVANAPVFTELFPLNVAIDQRVTEALTNSDTSVFLIGLQDVAMRMLASPEPAFLALAIVVFFLFLGHLLGAELRVVVALKTDQPDVAPELVSRTRRQAWVALTAAGTGVLITIAVLFFIRTQVLPMATERLKAADRQVEAAKKFVVQARAESESRDRIADLQEAVWRAEDERDRRIARRDYATSIDSANAAILGMNLVLVIVATLAGYFRKHLTLPAVPQTNDVPVATQPIAASPIDRNWRFELKGAPESSDSASEETVVGEFAMAERVTELRETLRVKRRELESSIAAADRAYAGARQLIHCNPTAKWEGITDRLRCAIPLFRLENAQARKLDTRDIKAFRQSPALDLKAPDERPLRPDLLASLDGTYERLGALRAAALTIASPGRTGHRVSDSQTEAVS